MMRHATTWLLGALLIGLAGASLRAHEETYKGTVTAVEVSKLQVNVIDDASKKATPMSFGVTARTKVFRGDAVVSFTDAKIQKDERIAVTINHDQPGHDATVIRLRAAK